MMKLTKEMKDVTDKPILKQALEPSILTKKLTNWEKFEYSLIQDMLSLSRLIDAHQKKRTANSTQAIIEWQLSLIRRVKGLFEQRTKLLKEVRERFMGEVENRIKYLEHHKGFYKNEDAGLLYDVRIRELQAMKDYLENLKEPEEGK